MHLTRGTLFYSPASKHNTFVPLLIAVVLLITFHAHAYSGGARRSGLVKRSLFSPQESSEEDSPSASPHAGNDEEGEAATAARNPSNALAPPKNLRANYDAASSSVFVEWESSGGGGGDEETTKYAVRYKVKRRGGGEGEEEEENWRILHPTPTGISPAEHGGGGGGRHSARLDIPPEGIRNGDEITVAVRALVEGEEEDRGSGWSDPPLTIVIEREEHQGGGEKEEGEMRAEDSQGEPTNVSGLKIFGVQSANPMETNTFAWSQHDRDEDEDSLQPPLNFTANVLSPTTVRLDWIPAPDGLTFRAAGSNPPGRFYYIVSVRQLPAVGATQQPLQRPRELKVEETSFLLGDLLAGERYEITVRTARSPERVSSAAAIVEIAMPKDDELFEVGNLIITSRFKADGSGVVNLTWEVPVALRHRIYAYDVSYIRSGDIPQHAPASPDQPPWQQIHFHGSSPTALLHHLRADTEYVLRIRTLLDGGRVQSDSGEFRFRTPRLAVNPISRLDVIYSSDTSAVRLQWILAPHIPLSNVAGYEVYIGDRQDQPEAEWRHLTADAAGADPQISVDGLQPRTTYFARVNVRNTDGTVVNSTSIYKFTTVDQLPPVVRGVAARRSVDHHHHSSPRHNPHGNRPHEAVGMGKGSAFISWRYPSRIEDDVAGAIVYYVEQGFAHRLPLERWQRVEVKGGAERTALTLVGLKENTVYSVKVVPQLWSNSNARRASRRGKAPVYGSEDQGLLEFPIMAEEES